MGTADAYRGPDHATMATHLGRLARPGHRYGLRPDAVRVSEKWSGPCTAQGEFQAKEQEKTEQKKSERAAIGQWVRAEQAGGVQAIAKTLNCGLKTCREKLEGFSTTGGMHRFVPPPGGDERNNSSLSSKGTILAL